MILSMTGFASSERDTINGVLIVELRSVNHRYLELQLKLDDSVRNFEPLIRELIAARLGRGKVECRLSLARRQNAEQQARLDQNALQQLAQLSAAVLQQFPQSQALSMADILRWPGVLGSDGTTLDEQALAQDIQTSLEQTLQQMAEARAREGGKLKQLILERLASMETRVAQVKPLLPAQLQAYQQRLAAKLQEAVSHVDADRLTQELTLFAQRIDVDEELTRLGAHMQEVRRILDADGMAGKRLDFLMQELNREANTLGSKSVSTEVTQAAMALKVLIEQMREQIQNIE
jgi:uncharacterized protein (TIGR00255 family)